MNCHVSNHYQTAYLSYSVGFTGIQKPIGFLHSRSIENFVQRYPSIPMAHYQVIIVGAGPAGIAAATRLMTRGINRIVLLEAENRIGGRIHTKPFGDGVIDLGAQFCHGETGNVVYDMAHPLDLLESSMPLYTNMCFVESCGQIVNKDVGSWLLGMCLDITDEAGKELKNYPRSLGDFITSEFHRRVKSTSAPVMTDTLPQNFLEWFHRFENSIDGSDSWFETSGSGHTEYKECEGDPVLVWKEAGYSRVLDLLMRKYPNPSLAIPVEPAIQLEKEVTKIEWDHMKNGRPVAVSCRDGSTFHADRMIVTVSLGVLKEAAQQIFAPPLPQQKLEAIDGLSIGTVNKIFIKFPEPWWPSDIHGFSLLWTNEDALNFKKKFGQNEKKAWLLEVFGFYKDLGQPGVLCGWIVGPAARSMELCSDQEVLEGCQELLLKFLGHTYHIPKITAIARSQWHSNPHFRGSYSFRSMKSDRMDVKASQLAEPLSNSDKQHVIYFAGEATHDHFFSTVHGAIETGWREADRILTDIRYTLCKQVLSVAAYLDGRWVTNSRNLSK